MKTGNKRRDIHWAAIVFAIVAWLAVVLPCRAQTAWYVSAGGDGAGGTNWGTAFTNIQTALNAAGGGDATIYLAGQIFPLTNQLIWPATNNISLLGGYAATNAVGPGEYDTRKWPTIVTLKAGFSNRLLLIQNTTNFTIERVTFRGGTAIEGSGLYAINAYGVIRQTVFENNRSPDDCWARGGGAYLSGGNLNFQDVVFANNWIDTMNVGWSAYGGAVYVGSGTHRFRNALIVGNRVTGYTGSWLAGSGFYIGNGSVALENVTVARNSSAAALYRAGGSLLVENSILWENDGGDYGGSIAFSNCCGAGLTNSAQGNITNAPLFEIPHFYLTTNSPCVAAGNRTVEAAGLTNLTSFTNGAPVSPGSAVNLGYHFPEGLKIDLDLWVDPVTGSDTNSGTVAESPLKSITKAVAQAAPRTRVNLAAGYYTNGVETFPLTIDTKTIQLVGTNRNGTIINSAAASQPVLILQNSLGDNRLEGVMITSGGSKRGLYVRNAVFTLAGCTITNNYETEGAGLYATSAHGVIRDVEFRNNETPVGWSRGGGAYISGGGLFLDRVIFSGNIARTMTVGWNAYGGGACIISGTHLFRNVLAAGNKITMTAAGASLIGSGFYIGGGPILCIGGPVVAFENATVLTNVGSAAIYNDSGAVTALNTILWDNPNGDNAGSATFANCCATGLVAGAQGNITNNPQFAGAATNDFTLQKTSLCVNAGANLPWMAGAVDLAGKPRINRRTVDMGAYETQLPPLGTMTWLR